MNGDEFKAIREKLNVGVAEFGMALGYRGDLNTMSRTIRRYETTRPIPDYLADVVTWLGQNGIPKNVDVQNPRVCDGYLLHGDRYAVRAYIAMGQGRRKNWLREWYYQRGREYLQFEASAESWSDGPKLGLQGPTSTTIVAIAAHEPIITGKAFDVWDSTLLGARLSVLSGGSTIAVWLRARQRVVA